MAFKVTEAAYPKWQELVAARQEASDTFDRLCVEVHGRNSGDYRYQPKRDTAELRAARKAYHETCDAVQAFLA